MEKQFLIPILFIFLISFASTLQAQNFTVKPGLVRMENEKLSLSLDVEAEYELRTTITSEANYPRERILDINAKGTVITNPDLNPKTQNLKIFYGYLVSFSKGQDDFVPGVEPAPSKDFGSLGLGIDVAYEANQSFKEQNLEGGLELRYQNSGNLLVPVFYAAFNFVQPLKSEVRETLNEDNDIFQRIDLSLQWTILYKRILFNPEFRYFYSMNLAQTIENTGLDEGLHGAVTLGYVFEGMDKPVLKYLRHIFVRYNRGQQPVYADQRETIEAGLTFSFN